MHVKKKEVPSRRLDLPSAPPQTKKAMKRVGGRAFYDIWLPAERREVEKKEVPFLGADSRRELEATDRSSPASRSGKFQVQEYRELARAPAGADVARVQQTRHSKIKKSVARR